MCVDHLPGQRGRGRGTTLTSFQLTVVVVGSVSVVKSTSRWVSEFVYLMIGGQEGVRTSPLSLAVCGWKLPAWGWAKHGGGGGGGL